MLVRNGREAIHFTVRRCSMAVNTLQAFLVRRIITAYVGEFGDVDRVDVASDTVLLDDAFSGFADSNDLRLGPKRENG